MGRLFHSPVDVHCARDARVTLDYIETVTRLFGSTEASRARNDPSVVYADEVKQSFPKATRCNAPAALRFRLYGVALQRGSTTARRCSVPRDKSCPALISSTRMLSAVGNLLAGATHSECNARRHVLLDTAKVRRAPGAGVALDNVALSSGRLDARRSRALSRSDTLCDVQVVVCIPVPSAYDLGGMPVVLQLSRTYLTRGNAHSRKFARTHSLWRSLSLDDSISVALHGRACASHSEGGHPYITPVDPCFRTDPKSRELPSSILLSPDATARPPLSALAAFLKTRNLHGPVGRWLVAGIEANLLSPGDAGTSATMPRVIVQPLPHAFSTRDSHVDKQIPYDVLEGFRTSMTVAVNSQSSYSRIVITLQGEREKTLPHAKLDVLVALTGRLGSAASAVLFAVLMIKFFTEPGTRSEEACNFVDILIIAITLIVVAVPEGLSLAVILVLAFVSRRMTGQNLLVHVLSQCDIITNTTAICTNKTRTLTQNLMTVVTDPSLAERRVDRSKLGSFHCSVQEVANVSTPEMLTKLCSTHVVAAKPGPGETHSQDDRIETKVIDELARDDMQWMAIFYANQSLQAYDGDACDVDMVLNERKTTGAAREAPNASLSLPSASPANRQRPVATACPGEIHVKASIPLSRQDCNSTCVLRASTRVNTWRSDLPRPHRRELTLPTSAPSVARAYTPLYPPTAPLVAADLVEPACLVPREPVDPAAQRAVATLNMLVAGVFTHTRTLCVCKGRRIFIARSLRVRATSSNVARVQVAASVEQRRTMLNSRSTPLDALQHLLLTLALVLLLVPSRVISRQRSIEPPLWVTYPIHLLQPYVRARCAVWSQQLLETFTHMHTIVSKKHHRRFFPRVDDGDKNGNCLPVTTFDQNTAHPTLFDFWLQSQAAVIGTARQRLISVSAAE